MLIKKNQHISNCICDYIIGLFYKKTLKVMPGDFAFLLWFIWVASICLVNLELM